MIDSITFLWNTFLYVPILNSLIFFYHLLGENLGAAIIAITVVIKVSTYPLTKPSIEAAKKQRLLQPEINKLKKKYKDKQALAKKQMELYKQHGINPASGCLPQIIQFIVVIALYRVFINLLNSNGLIATEINNLLYDFEYLKFSGDAALNTGFSYLNLAKSDPYYILPVLAAAAQLFMSRYMTRSTKILDKPVKDTPDKKDDFMQDMQKSMVYTMPAITLIVGASLPSGLVLYWFVSTLFALAQYVLIYRSNNKKSESNNKNGQRGSKE